MVDLTLEEWQRQSSLLLQARPTTTRIVTKYNVPNLETSRYQKDKKRKRAPELDGKDATTAPAAKIPKAALTLKTFDPASGVVLKFKTDRAADVGRLIAGLGRLGRHMAALPERTEDVTMQDAPTPAADGGAATSADGAQPTPASADKAQQPGGGKKKKKGKK